MSVKIFWDPNGFELDALGNKRHEAPPADGDTPYVRIPIRMLSIDTPETNYPGVGKPSNSDARLSELADWIDQGVAPVDDDLAAHLLPRLRTGTAGTLQQQQGEAAKEHFKNLLEQRLTRPSGRKRNVFLYAADEHFDSYGRLLAYMSPYLSKDELAAATLDDRKSFNLLMAESGWAATLIIFPSLPKYRDLTLFQAGAKKAVEDGLGAWGDPLMLTGYEWRMCIKLHGVTKKLAAGQKLSTSERFSWISRYCADIETLQVYSPQQYHKVPPYNRTFLWPADVRRAVADLNLTPGQ
jgi:endonuclease YncB( thermonuclease family)